jgi:hypothetical protein
MDFEQRLLIIFIGIISERLRSAKKVIYFFLNINITFLMRYISSSEIESLS